jgi:hypothetical protein
VPLNRAVGFVVRPESKSKPVQTREMLHCLRFPVRLTSEPVGALLGFHSDSIAFLAKSKRIKTLGQTEDVQLMFPAVHILENSITKPSGNVG